MKNILLTFMLLISQSIYAQTPHSMEIIAKISPPNPDPSGIAVSSDNRVFLGFPRHADNHKSFALAELKNGKLEPFPNKDFVFPSNNPVKERLVSPHGMYMDKNDILWIIDDGKLAGIEEIPQDAAKIIAIDIKSGKIIHNISITPNAMDNESHLNDLRVNPDMGTAGTAFITNSGFGKHYSLVVVDIASGACREVLKNHKTTSPEDGFMAFLEGEPRTLQPKEKSFPNGGADGITISPDGKKIFWTNISGRNLYSLPTEILANFSKPETEITANIKMEGQAPATDGLAEDSEGNIYFGAFEQQSVVKRSADGNYTLIGHDRENLVWPDGLAYKSGFIYVTLGQWNRLPDFNDGKDLRKPPYLVVRFKVKD